MTKIHCIVLYALICSWPAVAAEEKMFYVAPTELSGVERQMKTAGYWIGRHPSPDQVILGPQEIQSFNARIQDDLKLTKDIFTLTKNFQTESLVMSFDSTVAEISKKGYCTLDGERDLSGFMDRARRNMNLTGIVLGMAPRYGMVVRYANQRFLPVKDGLYETAGDVDFDQLQNSSLDIGTAVAVVHQSLDKKWFYVLSTLSDGWVEADRIALGDGKMVRDSVEGDNFIVVTAAKADVFLNEDMTQYHDHLRMGARLGLLGFSDDMLKVLVPTRDKEGRLAMATGHMKARDVSIGYLPYTPRTMFTQAFAMLDRPYGWGGVNGEQDCSAFLDEIFATVGIILPRDSKDQAQVGVPNIVFEEKAGVDQRVQAFKGLVGGSVILPMKGHIMYYLGSIEGKPYAIHALWAYREHKGDKDVPRVINRVTVSDLSLGEGSQKGSLLKRLTKLIEIK